MIATVLFGVGEGDGVLAGRNMYPVLGRPLMSYPLLAARAAHHAELIAISTNSTSMAQAAQSLGAEVIMRPQELCASSVPMGDVFRHAVSTLEARHGRQVRMLVVLL